MNAGYFVIACFLKLRLAHDVVPVRQASQNVPSMLDNIPHAIALAVFKVAYPQFLRSYDVRHTVNLMQ
jgi:hypothetical protein